MVHHRWLADFFWLVDVYKRQLLHFSVHDGQVRLEGCAYHVKVVLAHELSLIHISQCGYHYLIDFFRVFLQKNLEDFIGIFDFLRLETYYGKGMCGMW